MMKLQLLRLLLQPAAFIYEQCGQPIIVCTLAHCYSQTGGIRSLGNLAQSAAPCACPPPHLRAEIYSAHWNCHIFYCCYHKETRHSAPSGLLLSETFPHLHCFLHEASKKHCQDFTKVINYIITYNIRQHPQQLWPTEGQKVQTEELSRTVCT